MDAGDGEVYLFHNSSAVRLYHHFALHEYTVHAHGTFRCKSVISQAAEILMSLPRRQHVPCIKMRAFGVTHGVPFYPLLRKGMFYSHKTKSFNHIISLRVRIYGPLLYKALYLLK